MSLQSGSRLGGYEIVAPIGAGGMGEVYRARDTRIGRDVAIKILPDSFADNADRLARFQREAQSAGSLNHPNLLTIHELGVDGGRPFIVSELLDGTTLRERLNGGPLAPKRATDYASQIAEGLAAAHERGIVHRDLKPENIFITRDGRVKILDFGLAKTTATLHAGQTQAPTMQQVGATDPGTVLGTAGYMSPEQVRGDSVDARSDIFSLGAIVYEMLSGRRAFHASSSIDTMHAILHQDPPELSSTNPQVPPALERIVHHCLEKNAEQRFQSARDLAFDLAAVSGSSTELIAPPRRMRARVAPLAAVVAVVAAAVASWFVSRATFHQIAPRFHRLTFQSRGLPSAVFSADQQSVAYAFSGSGDADVYLSPIATPDMRSIGLPGATVLAVSHSGELAVLLHPRSVAPFISVGTLARVPLGGGAPRELVEDVQWADWMPSGDNLLILRTVKGSTRIELPIGNVIYETASWISTPRVSPDGETVAFIEHPRGGDDAGYVATVGRNRKRNVLTPTYATAWGVAWTPDGKEIWYTAAETGNSRALFAAGLSGKPRLLVAAPLALTIHDIDRNRRALVSEGNFRIRLFVRGPEDTRDRELSWLDWSLLRDITPDGRWVLFDESGEGGGTNYSAYVRKTDGSPPVRLGEGVAMRFSPDGKFVLAIRPRPHPPQIFAYPTGAGEPRQITSDSAVHDGAAWMPDGSSIVDWASMNGRPPRIYIDRLSGGAPRPITPEGASSQPVCSPDGQWVITRGPDNIVTMYATAGGKEIKLPEISREVRVVAFTPDSKQLVYFRRGEHGANVLQLFRFDIATRRAQLWKEIAGPDSIPGGIMMITPDGRTYAYSVITATSDLYLVDGLK